MCKACVGKIKGKGKKKKKDVTGDFFDAMDRAAGNGQYLTTNAYERVKPRSR